MLHDRGYRVRALYRRLPAPSHLKSLASGGVELIQADLAADDLSPLLHETPVVVHSAGLVKEWGPLQEFRQYNYDATVRLVEAAEQAGCAVFVHVSSAAVQGFGGHVGSTEEGPYHPPTSAYQVTKSMAEKDVLARNRPGFRTAAIRPGNVYGPRDTTTFDKLFALMRFGVMGYLDGGRYLTCPTYIGNLCDGIAAAIERTQSAGQAIIITDGERLTWADFLGEIQHHLGIGFIWLDGIPAWLARIATHILTQTYALLRLKSAPPLNPYRLEHACHDYDFDIEKARRLLGYSPRVNWRDGARITAQAYLKAPKHAPDRALIEP